MRRSGIGIVLSTFLRRNLFGGEVSARVRSVTIGTPCGGGGQGQGPVLPCRSPNRPSRSLHPAHHPPLVSSSATPSAGRKRAPGRPRRRSPREAPRRADRQSSGDDNLLGVRPPGPSPGNAVSIKSSKEKRPKRSTGEILTRRVEVSAPAVAGGEDERAGRRRAAADHGGRGRAVTGLAYEGSRVPRAWAGGVVSQAPIRRGASPSPPPRQARSRSTAGALGAAPGRR